ncbi:hypothetical protein [Allorhizocola rhizosphaerae]|uniref:hypothetical protein n=1 Tax=Allorhizocola rhizosphaerae TaxID=1872709 RepID=UPI000E3C8E7C|nr:hypothetical protein [Allorhizocola rhizosphaerae]
MHRLVVLFDESPGVTGRLEQRRAEPLLAEAVVCAVREADARGHRVIGVIDRRGERVVQAADLIVRLRGVARDLSEEELVLLLELLPL